MRPWSRSRPKRCSAAAERQCRAAAGAARSLRSSGSSLLIQAEPTTNSLVLQGEPIALEKVKQFAVEADQRSAEQTPVQKIFAVAHARAAEVAQAVQNLYGAGRARVGGIPSPTQVKAFASGAQVIVEAPKEKMPDIGDFIAQLDSTKSNEITVEPVKLPGVDVTQMARTLRLLRALSSAPMV